MSSTLVSEARHNLDTTVDTLLDRRGFWLAWKPVQYVICKNARTRAPVFLARLLAVDSGGGGRLNLRIEYPVGSGTVWPSLAAATLQMQRDARYLDQVTAVTSRSTSSSITSRQPSSVYDGVVDDGYGDSSSCYSAHDDDGGDTSLRPLGYDDVDYNVSCPPCVDVESITWNLLCEATHWHRLSTLLPTEVRNGSRPLVVIESSSNRATLLPVECPASVRGRLPAAHTTRQEVVDARLSLFSGWLMHDDEDLTFVSIPARRKYRAKRLTQHEPKEHGGGTTMNKESVVTHHYHYYGATTTTTSSPVATASSSISICANSDNNKSPFIPDADYSTHHGEAVAGDDMDHRLRYAKRRPVNRVGNSVDLIPTTTIMNSSLSPNQSKDMYVSRGIMPVIDLTLVDEDDDNAGRNRQTHSLVIDSPPSVSVASPPPKRLKLSSPPVESDDNVYGRDHHLSYVSAPLIEDLKAVTNPRCGASEEEHHGGTMVTGPTMPSSLSVSETHQHAIVAAVPSSLALYTSSKHKPPSNCPCRPDPERPWLVQMLCPHCRHMFTYDRQKYGPLPLIGTCPNTMCAISFCSGCGQQCPNGQLDGMHHNGTCTPENDCRQLFHMPWNAQGGDVVAVYQQLTAIYQKVRYNETPQSLQYAQNQQLEYTVQSSKALTTVPNNNEMYDRIISTFESSRSRISPDEWRMLALAHQCGLMDSWIRDGALKTIDYHSTL